MTTALLTLNAETSLFSIALNELESELKKLNGFETKLVKRLFSRLNATDKLFRLEVDNSPTKTSELLISFYPTDFLLMLTRTLRAWNG